MSHRHLKVAFGSVLAVLLGLLPACTQSNRDAERFVDDLENASKGLKTGEILRMDSVNTGKWDRMFLFPPYTPTGDIEVTLRSKLPSSITGSRISERDDINLIVFMNGGDVQLVATVVRSAVDFFTPTPRPLLRDNAQFNKPAPENRLVWIGQK